MKTSCLTYPKRDVFLQLHASLLKVCEERPIAAALIRYLAFWHDFCLDRQDQRAHALARMQRQSEPLPDDLGLWHEHSMAEFEKNLFGLAKEDTIRAEIRYLCERGFLETGPHPVKRDRWNQTRWYRLYPDVVQQALERLYPPATPPPADGAPQGSDMPQTPVAVQSGKIGDRDPKNRDSNPEKSGIKILDSSLDTFHKTPLPLVPPHSTQDTNTDASDPAPTAALSLGAAQPEPIVCEGGEVMTAAEELDAFTGSNVEDASAAVPPTATAEAFPTAETHTAVDSTTQDSSLGGEGETPHGAETHSESPTRPPGCHHLPSMPQDLEQHWEELCPDAEVRQQWEDQARRDLRHSKGGGLTAGCKPLIQNRAVELYEAHRARLRTQGVSVTGMLLHPPQRE